MSRLPTSPRTPDLTAAALAAPRLALMLALAGALAAAGGCTVVEGPAGEFRPADAPPPVVTPDEIAHDRIDARAVRRHIGFLASDERRGRGTPGDGLERSAAWIAAEFQRAGLEPAGDEGGFLQYWPYERTRLDPGSVVLEWDDGAMVYGEDFAALPGGSGGAGELVYLGRAEDAPDSMGAAAGRLAVVHLAGATADAWRWPITVRRSLITAARAEALGVVFILDPAFDRAAIAALTRDFERPMAEANRVPLFFVRESAAAALIEAAGGDPDALAAAAGSGAGDVVALEGVTVRARAPGITRAEQVPNVVGVLPAGSAERAEEYVILVAHYDHLGVGPPDESGDSIYNGADDNASGVAALVEVARAFGALPGPPARPVLFLAVSGEEQGLLGSTWFANNPTVFLSDAIAALNMDMVGRNHPDSIMVVGYDHSSLGPLIHDMIRATPELGLALAPDPGQDLFQRSDHFAFARRGIPAINFFSGLHDDYHQPSDQIDQVDPDKVARVARLVFLTAHRLAAEEITPEWTESGRAAIRR